MKLAACAGLAAALLHPARGEAPVPASGALEGFYRAVPAHPPRDPATAARFCALLPKGAPRLEPTLLDHLGDSRRTDVLRGKSLFALGCLMDGGEARCPGTLATLLIAIDADPDRDPVLRLAATDRLSTIAGRGSVPREARGASRPDFARWWVERGRSLHTDACAGVRL